MARRARATRLFSKPLPALAAALSLSCWALALGSAPAATAQRGHARAAPDTQAPANAPPAPSVQSALPASSPTGPAAGGKKRHEHGSTPSTPQGASTQQGGEPAGEAEGQAEALTTSDASRRQRERQRKKQHEEGKRGKEREGRHGRTPQPVPGEGAPGAKPTPVGVASSTALAEPAPSTPATVTPALAASPGAGGQLQSAGTGPSRRAARRRLRAPSPRPAPSAAPARRLAPAAVVQPARAPVARADGSRRAKAKAPDRPSPSPLVTTVTRIIDVVPPLVRILIGALVALALALGASSRLIARRARRLERQRRELLEDVGLLQAALLPTLPARLGPVGTSAAYAPASGPGAGGDFYDLFALGDGQLAVIVGDVSGHGRQALPHTTLLRFTLRAYLEAGLSPRGALQTAAPVLERQLGGSFATVALATYHPRDRLLVYACAGHPPPIVLGTGSIEPIVACSSPPIGAGMPTGTRQTVVSLPGASLACFFTDGLVEARVGDELFGVQRLRRTLAGLEPGATASALLDRVTEESDRRPDDMAACLLRIEGGADAPRVQVEELELDRREAAGDRVERFLLAGGVESQELGEVVRSARGAVKRHGGVVLELHLGDGSPEIVLRPSNVARLAPPDRVREHRAGMSR
ncbi:MAG TPA: SpoIIE family protein phosphatase [Solirubrobacteraceae bacterium]|nr:SpoIIE family protein phosphatase [Solirubrobacteraceae bacterium]